ncbi:MAG: anaerobic ribonucleoside-triphosphate reductase activating protein [Candidatus Pacebacteria bacterium]|nr:anaerobic ribonucleoside-triphosphate reductase activating protein [Candidatus Paceibacterota bacterium]
MQIGNLEKFTLIDYPGKLAATVFCLGCNFACPWCYNSELVLPEKIKKQPTISEEELLFFLKDRRGLLEGVCVCGGEPTLYQDLPEFLKKIKNLDYSVKLDTNGSNPEMLEKLIEENLVDYIAMDIKAPKEKYEKIIGNAKDIKNIVGRIQRSIAILNNSNVDYEFRTTIIPILLKKEDILEIARWIMPAKKYFLQNFQPIKTVDPDFNGVKPYSKDYLLEIQKAIEPFFEICQVR